MLEQRVNSVIAYLFIITVGVGFLVLILNSVEENIVNVVQGTVVNVGR